MISISLKSIKRGVFFSTLSMAANFALPLLVLPFLTRALGAHAFGELAIAQSVTIVLCQLVDFGFMLVGARQVAAMQNREGRISEIYSRIQTSRALLALFSLLIVFLLLVVDILPVSNFVLLWTALPAIIGTLFQATWFFQGKGFFGWLAFANMVSKIAYFFVVFYFVTTIESLPVAAGAFGLTYILSSIILFFAAFRSGAIWRIHLDVKAVVATLKEGGRGFLSLALLSIHSQIIVVAVGSLVGPVEAGVLAVADRVVRGMSALAVPFANALFPVFSRLYAEGASQASHLRRKTVLFMLLVSVFGSAILYFNANFIASFFLSGSQMDLICALKIMSPVPVFVAVSLVYGGLTLIPSGYDQDYLNAILFSELIGGVVFGLLIVLNNQLSGVWTILVTEFVLGAIMFYFVRMRLRNGDLGSLN